MSCSICISDFTTKMRKPVECPCGYDVCIQCTKTYLLQSPKDPHCMNCNKGWTRDFQYKLFGSSFINGEYSKHRKDVLFEYEKARLVETQYFAEQLRLENQMKNEINDISEKERALIEQLNALKNKRYDITHSLRIVANNINGGTLPAKRDSQGKQPLKCPKDDCKGYVIDKVCGICNSRVCKKCIKIIDNDDNDHVCNEDDLKTAQLILKESRPCPSCGTRISKVNGCDQMWCTQCHTAFSWRNGTVINGVIHNPHFYQWMQNGGTRGNQNRNPGDEVCGGIPNIYQLQRTFNHDYIKNLGLHKSISRIHRGLTHTQYNILNPLRTELNVQENNNRLRAQYMIDEISESDFKREIVKKDKKRCFNQAVLDIFETYVNVVSNHLHELLHTCNSSINNENNIKSINAFIDTCIKLKDYCNNELAKTSKYYKLVTWYINDNLSVSYEKKRF